MEAVKCPKCKVGQMVPLSGCISARTGDVQVMQYAEWTCVKCNYTIKAPTVTKI
jgi:predicted nucleic-acid-binding Zn-ribbon protein